ncbi:transglutaminase family protein [Rhodococcus sp. ABRD24]|uniref:transglutaminase-like domain-containing protein n=1 Tax=Rhodococcus sp. ABRD24 TaxID=2507582 RepID=UPI00103ED922|nr:transglutaminase family protein [Rhodococcus sp. ABRD24]QBJ94773.1 transglutaminase family protein [Rhodococcus sp. ABRD24]
MDVHLQPTRILDYDRPSIQVLIAERRWRDLPYGTRIGAVYDFVRDEIDFGYNASDALPASLVLADGYGQCNTKTTLLMALLRAVEVPCRFHGATIDKRLQKGIVDGILYRLAPRNILHSWAEVRFGDRWVELEGVILDADYLTGLRNTVAPGGAFLGYGAGTDDIGDPPVAWTGTDTAIQKTGVSRDLGTYDDPDAFYRQHGTNLTGLRNLLYQRMIRHLMNRTVASIRGCAITPAVRRPRPSARAEPR